MQCIGDYKKSIDEGSELVKFIFLKNSSFYLNQNATLDLPRYVNEADIAVEGGKNDQKLRKIAIQILNDVAQQQKTPAEGLKEYISKFAEIVAEQEQIDRKDPRLIESKYPSNKVEAACLYVTY